jgi:hypothetical protein
MAKARRGRYVELRQLRVKSKGENLELTFRIPWKSIQEVGNRFRKFFRTHSDS